MLAHQSILTPLAVCAKLPAYRLLEMELAYLQQVGSHPIWLAGERFFCCRNSDLFPVINGVKK